MIVLEDKGQKEKKHIAKNKYFASKNIDVMRVPLPVGDYVLMNDKIQDVIDRKSKRELELKKMDFLGTYNVSVDTKENLEEVVNNICGKAHPRFRDECILAQNNNIKLYILVENLDGIKTVQDVFSWVNPRRKRYFEIKNKQQYGKCFSVKLPKTPPTSGEILAKAILTMQAKYGVEFLFCKPLESAAKIIELLGGS